MKARLWEAVDDDRHHFAAAEISASAAPLVGRGKGVVGQNRYLEIDAVGGRWAAAAIRGQDGRQAEASPHDGAASLLAFMPNLSLSVEWAREDDAKPGPLSG